MTSDGAHEHGWVLGRFFVSPRMLPKRCRPAKTVDRGSMSPNTVPATKCVIFPYSLLFLSFSGDLQPL